MRSKFGILCCWCLALSAMAPCVSAETAVSSGPIEVYVDGRKFASPDAYKKKKDVDALEAAVVSTRQGAPAAVPPSVKPDESGNDLVMGKTVILRPDGTTITSETTLEAGKTIDVHPQSPGRVAGINPSFKQIAADFDSGKVDSGVHVIKVDNVEALIEDLRRKLHGQQRPLLMIQDKKKVKVMELNEVPAPQSPAIKP